MSCKTLQLNKCEIKGSTFSGRKFTFQNRDISNDKFKVVGYNNFKSTAIFTIDGIIIGNSVYFSYTDLEGLQSGAYILKFWAEFKDLATELIALENFKISTTPCCDGSSTGNNEFTLNFGEEIIDYELSITGSKGAPFTYEDFTQEQITDLQKPAIEASVVALEKAEKANMAADLANEKAGLANQSAINANSATAAANTATQNANDATTEATNAAQQATTATQESVTATENANRVVEQANEVISSATNATTDANTAAQSANTAAQVANNAKGWTPIFKFENDGDTRQVNKLVGYIGGTGIAPTDNIGSYVTENGYTLVKSEASNFKGSAGNLNAAFPRQPRTTNVIDLNNLTLEGVYYGYQWLNQPTQTSMIASLTVKTYSNDWIRQEFNIIDGTCLTYVRDRTGGTTWSNWKTLAYRDWLDNNYSPTTHTHTFASLTAKPTTIAGYGITDALTQASLTTQLANYATLNGVQTFKNTKTFEQSPVVPNGTLSTHAVNLSQLQQYSKLPSVQLTTATTSTIAFDNLLMKVTMQNGGTLNVSSVMVNQEIIVSNPSNTTLVINFTSLSLSYTLAAKSVATFEVLTGNKLLRRSVVENSTLLMN